MTPQSEFERLNAQWLADDLPIALDVENDKPVELPRLSVNADKVRARQLMIDAEFEAQ